MDATLARLGDAAVRQQLRGGFRLNKGTLDSVTLSYVAAPQYRSYEDMTLQHAAQVANMDVCEFICDVLAASGMAVGCVAPHSQRTEQDMQQLMRHPAMMAGSDAMPGSVS